MRAGAFLLAARFPGQDDGEVDRTRENIARLGAEVPSYLRERHGHR
ncbi:hypothetical protein GCM10023196_003160 [Actinoallomurus vinaceus]|uniref:Uncharacterized protein n=1 Tax=Actinoallomurus vinaceus TaxID=1080074 RepID=A0ABP8TZV6_9ACTN